MVQRKRSQNHKNSHRKAASQNQPFGNLIRNPKQLISFLDSTVYGQHSAKRGVALSLQDASNRFKHPNRKVQKKNLLIVGPTGCGKTSIVDAALGQISVPSASMKLSGVSTEGYVGDSISDVFGGLHTGAQSYGNDGRLTQIGFKAHSPHGIISLDEIDKLVGQSVNGSFGEGLQNELIGVVENESVPYSDFTTKDMTFIATGAFVGIEKIISKRLDKDKIGFGRIENSDDVNWLDYLTDTDLIAYGLKEELVGRFLQIAVVNPLTKKDMYKILKLPTGQLSEARGILHDEYGISTVVTEPAMDFMVTEAIKLKTYARGLNSVVSKVLEPLFFDPKAFRTSSMEAYPITPAHCEAAYKE